MNKELMIVIMALIFGAVAMTILLAATEYIPYNNVVGW